MINLPQMAEKEKVYKYLSEDGFVRASIVSATGLLKEMQRVNAMSPLASVTAGRALVGALLLASRQKDDQVSLNFNGNGPIGRVFAEASYGGKSRVNVANGHVDLPLKDGNLDVSGAIGIGILNVTHIAAYQKQSYKGTVIIKTGEVGSDIAHFLEQSFQIPSIVSLSVSITKEGFIDAAGGVLIELMPGHTEKHIQMLEANLDKAKPLSSLVKSGSSIQNILNEYTFGIAMKEVEHENDLEYFCPCNMDRVKNSLILLGEKEISALMVNDKDTEIACDFCGEKYYLTNDELEVLKLEAQKKSMH